MIDTRWSTLLEPISEDRPCGDDLSFSAEFDRIQEARREDDPTVDYGDWQSTLKQADWDEVVKNCGDLLQARSKDLRLAGWLAEGLVKTSGLPGLEAGLQLTTRLLERYGSHIHPQGDDGDQEQRIGTLSWYVMRMSQLVRQISITQGGTEQYNLNDYESARHLQMQMQRESVTERDLEQKVTLEKISDAIARTDKNLYLRWTEESDRCRAYVNDLSRVCDNLFGEEGPSFGPLAEGIEALHQRLQTIARDRGIVSVAGHEVRDEADTSEREIVHREASHGPLKTREQALESMRQVAAFFRHTEPHSPVSYLADKAVYWGSMPLHSWLRSVVKDHGTLSHLEEMLGIDRDVDTGRAEG
jgi:type VI secretion system protein ImpA